MQIKHIFPHYESPDARNEALKELSAELTVKLYNKRKLEKNQKRDEHGGIQRSG